MPAIKIGRIQIESFRFFPHFHENFEGASLIVFDGPNGFGKTSFYDAIELLLTGKIRRYDAWGKAVTDLRQKFKENPFPYNRNDGDLIIKLELEIDGEKMLLMRKGNREALNKQTRITDLNIPLYQLNDFDDDEGTLIDDEQKSLSLRLGDNYRENFKFLHYIEQEENIFLLKNSEKERKNSIDYLFNTIEFQMKIEELGIAISKITELCGKKEDDRLVNLNTEILALKASIMNETKETDYIKLITWGKFDWDEQEIEFSFGQYADFMGEAGILGQIWQFVTNFDEFKKSRENSMLDGFIRQKDKLKQILLYYTGLDIVDSYTDKLTIQQKAEKYLREIAKGVLAAILENNVDLDSFGTILKDKIDIQAYSTLKEKILGSHKSMSSFSEAAASLKDARASFVNKFDRYEQIGGKSKECPLCGYEWESSAELRLKLQAQEKKLDDLAKKSGEELYSFIKQFESDYISKIQGVFQAYLNDNKVDEKYIEGLREAARNKDSIIKLYAEIKSRGIQLVNYIATRGSENLDSGMADLIREIESKKQNIDEKRIQPYFPDLYITHFNEQEENVRKVLEENIEKKKEYLKWKYSIYQSGVLKAKLNDYAVKERQISNAKKMKDALGRLKKIYETSLKTYQKAIIGNIEILFHIYSGRIMQDCQGGMGLFIQEGDGIRFLVDPGKTHDAIFTMSSGQLAVLIIAFTLTLNKKYSHNKMLFIDDPVQTLDELNLASLVELLRNEFSDRQIFISTHEDKMSAYMRYKFDKYGLKTKRVSFKDQYLNPKA